MKKKIESMYIKTDFLVIGSGIAGLTFALRIAEYGEVIIITKKEDKESNTNYAQGGIASVIDKSDSFESHIQDTFIAGAGLCHEAAVRFMIKNGPQAIAQLLEIGVHFSRTKEGELELGREGGHSKNRIVHAHDFTGGEIEHALINRIKDHPRIQILQNHIAIDLITEHHTRHPDYHHGIHCWGSYVFDIKNNIIKTIIAKVTMLSTGGCGQVYLHTSNPPIATGDGIAMAYRAGAKIANLEFMQFHPTTLFHRRSNSFLISEAVRGFGGILCNKNGYHFMQEYHPMKELAPRDIVARAIDREMKKSGEPCVYLDLTHKNSNKIKNRFPNIYSKCLEFKIDITKEWIPVVPAAHYMCGGVVVNRESKSSVEGLLACGEVAFTGVHGANRLASNSLLEAVVFANTAVKAVTQQIKKKHHTIPEILPWNVEGTFNQEEWVYIVHDRKVIRTVMWDYVGIVRSNSRLERALRRLEMIEKEVEKYYKKTTLSSDLIELRNIATIARLIAKCAISRKESRGLHYNNNFPDKNDKKWLHDTIINNPLGISK